MQLQKSEITMFRHFGESPIEYGIFNGVTTFYKFITFQSE